MALSIADLEVNVKADTVHAERGLSGLSGKVGGFVGSVAKAGLVLAGLGAAASAALGVKAVMAASDLNETITKTDAVFKGNAKEIQAWSKASAQGFGQSRKEALEAVSTFGNMFVQLGVGSKEAAGMSKQMVELSSDFASFANASPVEVTNAMASAFRGEYDAVQRFVPTLTAAAVETKALEMGLAGTTKELTAQDKALATQALLMSGAGDAMGDFDRTSGGLANQMRIAKAEISDLSAQVGTKLLPIALGGISTLRDFAGAFQKGGLAGGIEFAKDQIGKFAPIVADGLSAAGDWIGANAGMIAGKLGEWGAALIEWIAPRIPGILLELGKILLSIGTWIATVAAPALAAKLVEWGKALVNWVMPQIPILLQNLGTMLGALGTWLLGTGIPVLVTKLFEWGKAFIGWIGPMIPPLLLELGKLLGRLGAWIVTEAVPMLVGKLFGWGMAFLAWIGPAIPKMLGELAKLLGNLMYWIATDAIPALIAAGPRLIAALVKWLIDVVPKLPRYLNTVGQTIITALSSLPGKLLTFGGELINGMIEGIKNAGPRLIAAVKQFITKAIPDFIKDVFGINSPSTLFSGFGKNLIEGFIGGIKDMAGKLVAAIKDFVIDKIPGPVKKALGIGSPSKLFYGFGKNLVEGLTLGISKNSGMVDSAIKDLSATASPNISPTFGGGLGAAGAGGGGGKTYVTNNNLSVTGSPVVMDEAVMAEYLRRMELLNAR